MSVLDPAAALAAGLTVVTPNTRLARTLIARHDAAMLRAGRRAWTGARALPWSVWLATLWREALEAGVAPPEARLLSVAESQFLWERIVREDASMRDGPLDPGGPAELAQEAWELVHAWGAGGESWRAWRGAADDESDTAAFARWAERYRRQLDARAVLDAAQLGDALREWAPRMREWHGRQIVMAGFLELAPAQERLCEALRAAGMTVALAGDVTHRSTVFRASPATPREELRAALTWARQLADAAPDRFIGIAVADLAAQRDDVRSMADDVLCPALQLPGHADAPRPYNLSLGAPLADLPMVAAALRLIALAHGALPRAEAAALARSPFWSGSWIERAACERRWIEEGRTTIAWNAFAQAFAPSDGTRLRSAIEGAALRTQSPASWATQWRTLLAQCGWPGTDAPYEARQAWERLLDAFAQVGHVEARLAAGEAPVLLRDMARRTIYQPESPPASIAIMGLLEAAALSFDALWVTGLSAQRWPPPPQPNPLLPLAWQRERGVPRASPERELEYAARLTARLAANAPTVVMSAPAAIEDYESAPSALIDPAWPVLELAQTTEDTAVRIAGTRDLESIRDDRAPMYTDAIAPGGAGTIASQSTCPFQAMARRRLGVEPWPGGFEALSYIERGQLVHATMAAFWAGVRTHAALVSLDRRALEALVAKAADAARSELSAERWRLLPPVVAASEVARIAGIALQWIDEFDMRRPPFTVAHVEESARVTLSGLTFRLKLDRVDTFADGSAAIIDYKTGAVDKPRSWFADRPRSPQLGIYALALKELTPPVEISAVAFARLKAGKIEALGVTATPANWPRLDDADKLREPQGWAAIEAWWARRLPEIAAEFRDGIATVTPRDAPACCRSCRLYALCRIGEAGQGGAAEEDEA